MPKHTVKYTQALETAKLAKIRIPDDSNRLYQMLSDEGFCWDSERQKWELPLEEPDEPSEIIRVRVWADSKKVERVAHQIVNVLEEQGFNFIEQSPRYACRPPKQLESRVYLSFTQKD